MKTNCRENAVNTPSKIKPYSVIPKVHQAIKGQSFTLLHHSVGGILDQFDRSWINHDRQTRVKIKESSLDERNRYRRTRS